MKTFDEVIEAMKVKDPRHIPEWIRRYDPMKNEMAEREEVNMIASHLIQNFLHPAVINALSQEMLDDLCSAIASGFTTGVMVGMEMEKAE